MCFLSMPEGQQVQEDAAHHVEEQVAAENRKLLAEEMKVESVLEALAEDWNFMYEYAPYLPDWIKQDILSDDFAAMCAEKFKTLDQNGNGSLEALELFPAVCEICGLHPLAITVEQCHKCLSIFDTDNNGTLSGGEFADFVRFIVVMQHLTASEDPGAV